jgi:hypothetical protein
MTRPIFPPNDLPRNFIELLIGMLGSTERMRFSWAQVFELQKKLDINLSEDTSQVDLDDDTTQIKRKKPGNNPSTPKTINNSIKKSTSNEKPMPVIERSTKPFPQLIKQCESIPKVKILSRVELIEKRLLIQYFYQTVLNDLLNNPSFREKDNVVLIQFCLCLSYERALTFEKRFFSQKDWDLERERNPNFREKFIILDNNLKKSRQIIVQEGRKIEAKFSSRKDLSSSERFFQHFVSDLSEDNIGSKNFDIVGSLENLVLINLRTESDSIKNRSIKFKDCFTYIYLIIAVHHQEIFSLPQDASASCLDPKDLLSQIDDFSKSDLLGLLTAWPERL